MLNTPFASFPSGGLVFLAPWRRFAMLAGAGFWFAIKHALSHALDEGLRYRLMGLHNFLEDMNPGGIDEIAAKLNETSELAELYEVFDAKGALIAQSTGLERHRVPARPPQNLGSRIHFESGGTRDFQLRLAWQKATIGGQELILGVADPQRKYEGVVRAFNSILLMSAPLVLIFATVCGLWLGRRALAPVGRIADDARAITETNLSARLAVPDSNDEVQQLSETLNEMLGRIEESFRRTRQFTSDASHELRAPMTLIYTAAQFSLRRERSREELTDSMQKILRESKRTAALIDDLLLLARGDSGKETIELKTLDVVPLLGDLNEQTAAIAAAKEIRLAVRVDARWRIGNLAGPKGRSLTAAASTDPGGQCHQIYAFGRKNRRRRFRGVGARLDRGYGYRSRNRRGRFATCIRAVLACRQRPVQGRGRHGTRIDDRPADRRPARRHAERGEARSGKGPHSRCGSRRLPVEQLKFSAVFQVLPISWLQDGMKNSAATANPGGKQRA